MKSFSALPDDYQELFSINFQTDKKFALIVNVLSILMAVIMIIPVHLIYPITMLFNIEEGIDGVLLRMAVFLVGLGLCIILHEITHGIAMRICGTKKIKYGFSAICAFAASDDYYDKRSYIFIALAPVVLWGVVIGCANFIVPVEWIWVVYLIQCVNISGAAADVFVSMELLFLHKDIIVLDSGVSMLIYSKEVQSHFINEQ